MSKVIEQAHQLQYIQQILCLTAEWFTLSHAGSCLHLYAYSNACDMTFVWMSQSMIKMFDPVLTWAARKYQAAVATELKKYGLRYEDLYDPQLNMVSLTQNALCCLHFL